MLRDARIAALYAETNERKILRPFSRDPDYVVLLYSLEIRHRAVQLIKEGSSVIVMQWTGVIRDGTLI